MSRMGITFYFIPFCFSVIPDLQEKVVIGLTQIPAVIMDYLTGTIYVILLFLNTFYPNMMSSGKVACSIACKCITGDFYAESLPT